jgi:predicted lactoylglutathione lyase
MIAVCTPYDGGRAQPGNGTMVSLAAPDRATVDRVHAKALSLGAADEGAPGERMPTFYGAYFRDLDGNKFCVFKMG